MKLLLQTMFLIILISCGKTYEESCGTYQEVINDLSNNHVLLFESMGAEYYLDYYDLNESEYKIKVKMYNKAINCFYKSDENMINYLLSFENDTKIFSNWIRTPNPYSAVRTQQDFISNSEAAMILLDNFLLNEEKNQIIEKRLSDLSYREFNNFYKFENNKRLSQIRKDYKLVVANDNASVTKGNVPE